MREDRLTMIRFRSFVTIAGSVPILFAGVVRFVSVGPLGTLDFGDEMGQSAVAKQLRFRLHF